MRLRKPLVNDSLANKKLSKTQLHKIGQSDYLLGRLLPRFLKTGLPLMKNVLNLLIKSSSIPVQLTAATDAAIQKI